MPSVTCFQVEESEVYESGGRYCTQACCCALTEHQLVVTEEEIVIVVSLLTPNSHLSHYLLQCSADDIPFNVTSSDTLVSSRRAFIAYVSCTAGKQPTTLSTRSISSESAESFLRRAFDAYLIPMLAIVLLGPEARIRVYSPVHLLISLKSYLRQTTSLRFRDHVSNSIDQSTCWLRIIEGRLLFPQI